MWTNELLQLKANIQNSRSIGQIVCFLERKQIWNIIYNFKTLILKKKKTSKLIEILLLNI